MVKMLRVVAGLVLLAAVATYAQIPHHCLVHHELTFRMFQHNHNFSTVREFLAEYDARNERIAFVEKERRGTGVQLQKVIILFHERVGFDYNIKTKECTRFHPGHFFPWGVPPHAHFDAEFTLGGPGESAEAVDWKDHDTKEEVSWRGLFTRVECYPIRFWHRNDQKNHTLSTNIYDIADGLVDPEAFIPPHECHHHRVPTKEPSEKVVDLMKVFRLD